jgi:hypothetical protein
MPQIPKRIFNRAGKSQISIFNDQNIYYSCIASLRKPRSTGDDAIGTTEDGSFLLNFEFGSLGFV